VRGDDVVAECLAQVPTPPTGELGQPPKAGAGGQAPAGEPAGRPG
jgi:hypothetical protein